MTATKLLRKTAVRKLIPRLTVFTEPNNIHMVNTLFFVYTPQETDMSLYGRLHKHIFLHKHIPQFYCFIIIILRSQFF